MLLNEPSNCLFSFSKGYEPIRIGLLDISGYENFKQNSLEQLLINTTNEQIQYAFQRQTYEYEQELYQREGLSYPRVAYKSNKKIVDLLMQVSECF